MVSTTELTVRLEELAAIEDKIHKHEQALKKAKSELAQWKKQNDSDITEYMLSKFNKYNIKEEITRTHVIHLKMHKTALFDYNNKDTELVAWAKEKFPHTLQNSAINKITFNRILRTYKKLNELPDQVSMKVPDPKIILTRIS